MSSVIGKTCPYCQTPIKPGAAVTECSRCGIPHHRECWDHNNGCTTFGCTGGRSDARPGLGPASAAPASLDLTDIPLSDDRRPARSRRQSGPTTTAGEPPLVAAAQAVAGVGGMLGAIIGFIAGLGAGGIGCIPGAILGFFVGAAIGGLLLYALILVVTAGLGSAICSGMGPDAAPVGAVIGLVVGIVLIALGCSRRQR